MHVLSLGSSDNSSEQLSRDPRHYRYLELNCWIDKEAYVEILTTNDFLRVMITKATEIDSHKYLNQKKMFLLLKIAEAIKDFK